jgi:hypothetical protein
MLFTLPQSSNFGLLLGTPALGSSPLLEQMLQRRPLIPRVISSALPTDSTRAV